VLARRRPPRRRARREDAGYGACGLERGATGAPARWGYGRCSVPRGAVLRPGPNAPQLERFQFSIRATSADVKSAIAGLRIFAGRVADTGEQSISNKSFALVYSVVVPKLQGHRATARGVPRNGAVPQRQTVEDRRVVESDVEGQNCRPRKAHASVFPTAALLFCETRVFERESLPSSHRVCLTTAVRRLGRHWAACADRRRLR